jgi:hypothetical protein
LEVSLKKIDLSGARWRKSTRSSAGNGASCVEVAFLDNGDVAVRDSKDRQGPALVFRSHEWTAFVGGIKEGEFELPA